MKILGLSAFYHDSAVALVVDGEIVAAAQEERFTRKKFDPNFPEHSLRFCLKTANLHLSDLDEIVYYEKPFLSFERLLESIVATAPGSLSTFLVSMPMWMREKLNTRATIQKNLKRIFHKEKIPIVGFSKHHLSHAASAFYPSPFESAAVLCLDGVGERVCASGWLGEGNQLMNLWEMNFPHSLGLLYSAFTDFCGFKVNSGEYKLMGLAPHGEPSYVPLIRQHLIDLKEDGSFRLNMKYFAFATSLKMTNKKFAELFKIPPRKPEGPMSIEYKNMAASIQKVTEDIILRLARTLRQQSNQEDLCLAGGVALNCVANGLISRSQIFRNIWIQPAAGDSGAALGAALASYYLQHRCTRSTQKPDSMKGSLLGPSYSDGEIEGLLQNAGVNYIKLDQARLIDRATEDLQSQKVIGWFQGAMEYGPRSLGSRSILGDPRNPKMQSHMNLKIKFRESFRPFAPVILANKVSEVYQDKFESPYMLFVSRIKKKFLKDFPSVTHLDGSARLQSVTAASNALLFLLLKKFEEKTGCPMLINTSFNVRGEPMVCSPLDALRCFVQTDIDSLFLGSFYILKEGQSIHRDDPKWKTSYELD